MFPDVSSVVQGPLSGAASGSLKECASCGKRITERFLLKALDLFWHEDCLKCGCCDCRLGEVGSTLYQKANLILCKRDYLRCEYFHFKKKKLKRISKLSIKKILPASPKVDNIIMEFSQNIILRISP